MSEAHARVLPTSRTNVASQESPAPLQPVQASPLSFDELSRAMDDFVRDKGWYEPASKRPQTPRNLAASLVIEAGELLECFQWGEWSDRERVKDELADIILYAVQLARVADCDLTAAVLEKLERNRTREWDRDSEIRP